MFMSKRILSVFLFLALFVLVFQSGAGAASEELNEARCIDGATSANGSAIVGGVWSGGNTCTATSITMMTGDELTIPSGVALSTLGRVDVDGGSIVNVGTITASDYVDVRNSGSVNNSGTINAALAVAADSSMTNSGSVLSPSVEVHGTLTNTGQIEANDVRVWGTLNNEYWVLTFDSSIWGTFNNHQLFQIHTSISVYAESGSVINYCGSFFSAEEIATGEDRIVYEDCEAPTGITVTEVCDDGVDMLRIENVSDEYITYSIFLDDAVFEEDYDSYSGDEDDFPLPTGHSKYSTTWHWTYPGEVGNDETVYVGPSGDLPICAQATTTTVPETTTSTTIPEVETDIANGDGTNAAVPVLIAVGFLTLAAVALRARRIER
jgi:hypothetical protein